MSLFLHQNICLGKSGVSRRSFLHHVAAGAIAAGTLNFRDLMTVQAEELRKQGMSLIVLWMQGGPSQFETFDPKPGTDHGGPTKAIETAVPGIHIAEGWEPVAKVMKDVAIIRSMTNKEGQHARASYQLHTGYLPAGSVRYPNLGCSIAKELALPNQDLPSVVSVGQTQGSGFLGVDLEPFVVRHAGELPSNVSLPVNVDRFQRRSGLLHSLEQGFADQAGTIAVADHRRLYEKASRLILSPQIKVFDVSTESSELKSQYGDSEFGRACLLARRLVESGVTFVEVRSTKGWDTHKDNFAAVAKNASDVAPAMAALISDLKQRGMLDKTLVVWMGEFGRTPKINGNSGRDHYPKVFNMALAGAGIHGGQVIGSSNAEGTAVKDHPVTVSDLLSTVCKAMKVDSKKENLSPLGRPIKIVDGGKPIEQLFS